MHEPWDDPVAALARAGLPPPLARPAGAGDASDAQGRHFGPLLLATTPARPATATRRRLLERVLRSAGDARALHTRRHADTVPAEACAGVTLRSLYRAAGAARRPGEPDAVTLVELAPGASWAGPASPSATSPGPDQPLQRECLVLQGCVQVGEVLLGARDYHVVPAGLGIGAWSTARGALLYVREAQPAAGAPGRVVTQRAGSAAWVDHAPGIRRRILWRQDAQAAMLYHALPGAAVPPHGHRHDEECLMLAGDFFLDEVLLRPLDYQIAPAGTGHRVASTDTGVVLYAHGDVDLDVR